MDGLILPISCNNRLEGKSHSL
uniref:Uncharacterized protein n=1 Tax=Rhizophora mucronata TaxID=61149 RepID=A0A2P2PF96_RHIMU